MSPNLTHFLEMFDSICWTLEDCTSALCSSSWWF
jgi:hypothetical protein